MSEQHSCRWCGDVIGAHEEMFVVAEGEAHEVRDRADHVPAGDCYHDACFQVRAGRRPAPRSRPYQ